VILDSTSLFGLELRVSIRKIAISRRIGVDCTPTVLCLAKTLSLSENQQFWHNFLNLKICYDYGTCSTSPG
jgi:hypothetical protein